MKPDADSRARGFRGIAEHGVVLRESCELLQVLDRRALFVFIHPRLQRRVDVRLANHPHEPREVVAHEVRERVLPESALHRAPRVQIRPLVLLLWQPHEEIVADQVCLRKRTALAIQALEDPVRVVSVVEDDAHKGEPGDEHSEQIVEVRCIGAPQLASEELVRGSDSTLRGGRVAMHEANERLAVALRRVLALRRQQLVVVRPVLVTVGHQIVDAIGELRQALLASPVADQRQQDQQRCQALLTVDEQALLDSLWDRSRWGGHDRPEEVRLGLRVYQVTAPA